MKILVIADDFTGATDIAGFLVENGLQTIQINGVPTMDVAADIEACVVSLKTRSCHVNEAISQSLAAYEWGKKQGAEKFFFKYCSTFDSTEKGNIGPVTDALLEAMGEKMTVVCPALPVNGRSVYQGYLFVGDKLLNESGMQNHPITPMKDANLLRLMEAQARGKAGLINQIVVNAGAPAIAEAMSVLKVEEKQYIVIDSITMEDLDIVATAIYDEVKLFTGGSGLGGALAKHIKSGQTAGQSATNLGKPQRNEAVILSGSCSLMTQAQVKLYKEQAPALQIDVEKCLNDKDYVNTLVSWYLEHKDGLVAPLFYATTDVESLKEIQEKYGSEKASQAVEQTFYDLAIKLKDNGVKNFIVAGGETSGSVTQALNVKAFYIGPQIAPGVPWVRSLDDDLSLALKSGNFGDEQFFFKSQDFINL